MPFSSCVLHSKYQNYLYIFTYLCTSVPGVSRTVENCYCPETAPVVPSIWYHRGSANKFYDTWVMAEWLLAKSGWRGWHEILGPAFEARIQHMKQMAHNCYIPPAAKARRHVPKFPPYKNDDYMPVQDVRRSEENLSCPGSIRCCARYVIPYSQVPSANTFYDGWVISPYKNYIYSIFSTIMVNWLLLRRLVPSY